MEPVHREIKLSKYCKLCTLDCCINIGKHYVLIVQHCVDVFKRTCVRESECFVLKMGGFTDNCFYLVTAWPTPAYQDPLNKFQYEEMFVSNWTWLTKGCCRCRSDPVDLKVKVTTFTSDSYWDITCKTLHKFVLIMKLHDITIKLCTKLYIIMKLYDVTIKLCTELYVITKLHDVSAKTTQRRRASSTEIGNITSQMYLLRAQSRVPLTTLDTT